MPVIREKTDLDKKLNWFIFMGANVVVLLGCAITWILIEQGVGNLLWLPTLICNLVAIGLAGLFGYFEVKDIAPKIMHFQRKWLKFYIIAFSIFVVAILFNVCYYLFFLSKSDLIVLKNQKWQLIVYFAITGVLTLVSIGFQRYARFRIDLDVYRRKHGEEIKNKEDLKKEKKETKPEQKPEEKKQPGQQGASGGLIDQMDK